MDQDQREPDQREPEDQATPYVPPGMNGRRPVDLERYSISARRL